jgi:UPF0755 protein
MIKWLKAFLFFGFLLAILGLIQINKKINKNVESFIVRKNESMQSISQRLYDQKIISDEKIFYISYRVLSFISDVSPKFGEFEFQNGLSYYQLMKKISSNDVVQRKISFPEGLLTQEIIDIINKEKSLSGNIDIKIHEGDLLPETYYYTIGDTKNDIIMRMKKDMDATIEKAVQINKNLHLKNKHDILKMASIIEKEAKFEEEKPIISSVFTNRLDKKMRLQSDPTAMYEITNGKVDLHRAPTPSELRSGKTHNTYMINGLPLTPICAPSKTSIFAAVNPAKTNYLYFVWNGTDQGSHIFSETYERHIENIKILRANRNKSIVDGSEDSLLD